MSFTPAQTTILQTLAAKGPQARKPLMDAASIGHNTMAKVFESLEYRGLVTEGERPKGRALCLIEITDKGRKALADLERGIVPDYGRVPPPSINKMQGFYRPPLAQFCRNNGHVHIASRGVGC